MSTVLAVARREVQAYFVSPVAYVFIVVFLAIMAFGFNFTLQLYSRIPSTILAETGANIRTRIVGGPEGIVTWAFIAILVSLPGLSMRLFSEERRSGTIELLFTSPLTTAQLVAGKFIGTLAVFAGILVLTFPLIGVIAWKADPEWAALGAAYLGILLFGGVVLAIGLFASSLTETQFVALVLTYAILAPLLVVRFAAGIVLGHGEEILADLAVRYGLRQFGVGLVDSHYLVLYGVLAGGFLFLSARVLDSSRWR